ncbi:MAG: hypothetical protein WD768_14480 [Phycisphaeraceae bacterium]
MSKHDDDNADEGEIRVQVPVKADYLRRVDELATKMGVGRGRMIAMLLEAGVDDNDWMIKIVTSKFMAPVVNVVKGWMGRGKGKAEPKGM